MVLLDDVLASNARIPTSLPPKLVAVFAGATTGIGEATLKAFVKYAVEPRIYLMARSPTSAQRVIEECKTLNPKAEYTTINVDLSFIRETDRACNEIIAKESAVNLLMLSVGEISLDRSRTEEGLHKFLTTTFYTRIRLAQNFLPLLKNASNTSPLARVVNVGGGTKEGKIDTSDLTAIRMPFSHIRPHLTCVKTLALEKLAQQAPTVSFIHDFPGAVLTPLYDDVPGVMGFLIRTVVLLVKVLFGRWICVPIEECGERHVHMATSGKYEPKEGKAAGLPLLEGEMVSRGSDGEVGSGVYSIDWDGEGPKAEAAAALRKQRENGVREVVWNHLDQEFKRIAASVASS
ncbi:hypothetical protein CC78DRAFT_528839 [Lojkania enalia]|uniref:NAD(P)-binding protein n=1 Tax=Lojkania enalia TaxID=147567 RepID=A0A9P4NAH9_9PLEO|nr:hypothetical protein CC78DRAFT_528839 [Didymosphaeria enalia]